LLKKVTAILVLGILLVNAVGYRFILGIRQKQAHTQMVARLDNNQYSEAELIEIAAPLNLPYFTNWQHFERCDGQITINGTVYNYVARKYVNNVMIYKCIPNRAVQQVISTQKQMDELAFGAHATNPPGKHKSPLSSQGNSPLEYDDVIAMAQLAPLAALTKTNYPLHTEPLYGSYATSPYQPPEL
jgi:hypothetical protein